MAHSSALPMLIFPRIRQLLLRLLTGSFLFSLIYHLDTATAANRLLHWLTITLATSFLKLLCTPDTLQTLLQPWEHHSRNTTSTFHLRRWNRTCRAHNLNWQVPHNRDGLVSIGTRQTGHWKGRL